MTENELLNVLKKIVAKNELSVSISNLFQNAKAYWHPNHFVKIICRSPDAIIPKNTKLVLHTWLPEQFSEENEYDIHNHRWSFASYCVTGQLAAASYSKIPPGMPNDYILREEWEYRSPRNSGHAPTSRVGQIALATGDRKTMKAGQFHSLDERSIHLVLPATRQLTSTLVLQGPPSKESCEIFLSKKRQPVEDARQILWLQQHEVKSVIERVLTEIDRI